MANQSMLSIASTNHDDFCNWELINHFDVDFDTSVIVINDDDDDTIYDLIESFDSLSSTSSSSDHDHENQGLTIDHHNHDDVVVDDGDVRVSDLGENNGVSNCVGKQDENDGVIEYFNGSRSILYGHDDGHVNYDVDDGVNCFRVSNLGENYDVSNYVGNLDKNDGVIENFNGSSSVLYEYDDGHVNHDVNHVDDVDDDDVDVDGGGGDDDDGYGMDDELVPWEVKDRLMRQRIRKSGKNYIGKLGKSKKSALVFTRPGCVRGKHGLGLKVY